MTTKIISVITAAHGPSAQYLADAYESLTSQNLPDDWSWEWIVQEDGETGLVVDALPRDERIKPGTSIARGPAIARTMALTRATGSLVRNFDADDMLRDGALSRDIDILTRHADVGWVTSRVLDLHTDGTTSSWVHEDPDEGILKQGSIVDYYRTHDGQLPVHPMTLCIRHNLIVAIGGWMALSSSEDTGLLLAADALADGYFVHEPSVLYRQHDKQETTQAHHIDPNERAARTRLIIARAHALRSLVGSHHDARCVAPSVLRH